MWTWCKQKCNEELVGSIQYESAVLSSLSEGCVSGSNTSLWCVARQLPVTANAWWLNNTINSNMKESSAPLNTDKLVNIPPLLYYQLKYSLVFGWRAAIVIHHSVLGSVC